MRLFQVVILFLLVILPFAAAMTDDTAPKAANTADVVSSADLPTLPADPPSAAGQTTGSDAAFPPATPDPAIVELMD